jgi:hypothetical protein
MFHAANKCDFKEWKLTGIYFSRTKEILKAGGVDKYAWLYPPSLRCRNKGCPLRTRSRVLARLSRAGALQLEMTR